MTHPDTAQAHPSSREEFLRPPRLTISIQIGEGIMFIWDNKAEELDRCMICGFVHSPADHLLGPQRNFHSLPNLKHNWKVMLLVSRCFFELANFCLLLCFPGMHGLKLSAAGGLFLRQPNRKWQATSQTGDLSEVVEAALILFKRVASFKDNLCPQELESGWLQLLCLPTTCPTLPPFRDNPHY